MLLVPALPWPSARAPLLTRVLMALQARAIVSSRSRRSALMRFLSRCRASRNWLRVTRRMPCILRRLSAIARRRLAASEPCGAEQAAGQQPEHGRHADGQRESAGAQRNERLAGVDHGGADAYR